MRPSSIPDPPSRVSFNESGCGRRTVGTELHLVKRRLQPLQPGRRGVPKGNTCLLAMHEDRLDAERAPKYAQERCREEVGRRCGERTEPVAHLVPQLLDGRRIAEAMVRRRYTSSFASCDGM